MSTNITEYQYYDLLSRNKELEAENVRLQERNSSLLRQSKAVIKDYRIEADRLRKALELLNELYRDFDVSVEDYLHTSEQVIKAALEGKE